MKIGDIYSLKTQYGCRFVEIVDVGDRVTYEHHGRNYTRRTDTFERDSEPIDMDLHNQDKVTVTDVEHCEVHSDAGRHGLEFQCPVCDGNVIHAERGWWSEDCRCRTWTVEIKAIGTKKERPFR